MARPRQAGRVHAGTLVIALCCAMARATLPSYEGLGQAVNPDGPCAQIACYQELPDECCPFPYNYQGGFLGAQQNLVSALGFWKTLFAQTACVPRCQSAVFSDRFRQCLEANKLYAENYDELLNSNVCNGACMYANKAAWQQLTNATGPCSTLSTQPGVLSCSTECAAVLRLVPRDCRAAAASVTYKNYGQFLTNAFAACNLEVPEVCTQAGYAGCQIIQDIEGAGSSAASVVVSQVTQAGGTV